MASTNETKVRSGTLSISQRNGRYDIHLNRTLMHTYRTEAEAVEAMAKLAEEMNNG